jgi:hypothetical protein
MKDQCCLFVKVQRVYYKIQDLEISCPEDFDYEDLYTDVSAFILRYFINPYVSGQ